MRMKNRQRSVSRKDGLPLKIKKRRFNSIRIIAISFLGVILVGSLFLLVKACGHILSMPFFGRMGRLFLSGKGRSTVQTSSRRTNIVLTVSIRNDKNGRIYDN